MELLRLTTGDVAYRYDKSIVLCFKGRRKVLSTSLYNGGYHEDFVAVYNRDMTQGAGMPCESFAPRYEDHMRIVSERLGLDPALVTGMGTAAQMEKCAVRTESFRELTVTVIATGGIETNGGRVGDPASYYHPVEKERPGTINIILAIDADLPPGIMARALVTCTEAKTAALQELMADSRYSSGLATGSGTDQTILVVNAESPLCFENAGKYSKLGELIGKAVTAAVKETLGKHGLTPVVQHDLLRRLRRFGITSDTIWRRYRDGAKEKAAIKPRFVTALAELAQSSDFLTYGALYVHLYDEYVWGLISAEEMEKAAEHLLLCLAETAGVSAPGIAAPDEGCMQAMERLLSEASEKKLRDTPLPVQECARAKRNKKAGE